MIRAALILALLVGCSSTPSTSGPDPTDERICAAALQPPWNDGLITSLTRSPQTPIQEQARTTQDLFDAGKTASGDEWRALSQMCVDAGF